MTEFLQHVSNGTGHNFWTCISKLWITWATGIKEGIKNELILYNCNGKILNNEINPIIPLWLCKIHLN
jgi:hypothetical protein